MSLNWQCGDYFEHLQNDVDGPESHSALELLVDDLHREKQQTVGAFLAHYGSEDFLWALVRMLSAENTRVAGNSAYIFGTIAENEQGQARVLSLINGSHPQNVLADLTNMLDYNDDESVMNAAGTLGTLAESPGGREWLLGEPCLQVTISRVTSLLTSHNLWTASNSALVLARLSISEEGCKLLLDHTFSHQILMKLIESLGIDEAGRGMNAAFALGRLCDLEIGRTRLLQHPVSEKMMNRLCGMLSSKDPGCGKNACYAISCLATSIQGHERLLGHGSSEVMLQRLGSQLSNEDGETAWFAAMTLRTLASKTAGCIRLRNHPHVVPALQNVKCQGTSHQDLKDEVELTLELLKPLQQPSPPRLEVKGHGEINAEWDEVKLKSGLEVTYKLFNDSKLLYEGTSLNHLITGLRADTRYSFRLQLSTDGDESPLGDVSIATTDNAPPDAPEGLRIIGVTTSQLKLSWAAPEFNNGALKGYVVYNGKQQVESTSELSCIVSGLMPGTMYELHVCAFNHKGKGPRATIKASTTELGKHAPGKPTLTIRGRSEIHVTWTPPEFPLGRLHRFELTQNGKVIYSGTGLSYTAHRLTPNTEYKFTVIAVTSEGKCESDAAKKRTPKDEYNVQSTAPIYFSHPTRTAEDPTGKTKDKTRTHSRQSLKRDTSARQRQTKQPISPTSTEPPNLRSLSRLSSSCSDDSFQHSVAKKQSRRKKSVSVVEKGSKSPVTMAPLKECSSKYRAKDSNSTSGENEDKWPGAADTGSDYRAAERNQRFGSSVSHASPSKCASLRGDPDDSETRSSLESYHSIQRNHATHQITSINSQDKSSKPSSSGSTRSDLSSCERNESVEHASMEGSQLSSTTSLGKHRQSPNRVSSGSKPSSCGSTRCDLSSSETSESVEHASLEGSQLSCTTLQTSLGKHKKSPNGVQPGSTSQGISHGDCGNCETSWSAADKSSSRTSSGNSSDKSSRKCKKEALTDRSSSDEVKPQVRSHTKENTKESSPSFKNYFDSPQRHFGSHEARKSSKSLGTSSKHKQVSGDKLKSDPTTFKLDRLLRSLKSTTVHSTLSHSDRTVPYATDGLQRMRMNVTWDPRLSSTLGPSLNVPTQDLRLNSLPSTQDVVSRSSTTLGKAFTFLSNGQIVYRDSKFRNGATRKTYFCSDTTSAEGERKLAKDKRYCASRTSLPDLSLQPLPQGHLSTDTVIAELPWEGGDGPNFNTAPAASWTTQPRTALVNSAVPYRSALANYSSRYQRANSITNSHRPTLKKNPATYQGMFHNHQGVSPTQYAPDFSSNKPVACNKYQFIPTQYRTQPTHLPGTTPTRTNVAPSSSYDKVGYSKKLDSLSRFSTERKTGIVCHDCRPDNNGRTMVALKYSHRSDL